ncbi:Prolyl-tRNA editing protein ProX [Jeotgalibaca dankookensis]|uniref:Prolyl-tRNA editing protein ProX n=1 Tax=Jeotgalibaca dankookensis TaxID=708126 RepID=A0A1S6IQ02_9LACT|nr:prolyl-tRNA synthetase associated domain-containing protein [Jeotgalibaca dankookensis]AQS53624.1 Prolyl-tRNA editing protein ProX [Jeotgalibaca dankookensis]
MEAYEQVKEKLDTLKIGFEVVEHEPALITEQANHFIEGVEGVRTKTMFLTDKKKRNFYLVIMDDSKRMDMKRFSEIIQTKRIKIASSESLYEKMHLPPGVVSPFGLLNNTDNDIRVYIDKEIMSEQRMSFHFKTDELVKYLESIGYEVHMFEM